MERRSFLKYLLSTPLAAVIDYEKLLWVPKPIIVVPSMPVNLRTAYGRIYFGAGWSSKEPFTAWVHPAQHKAYKEIAAMVELIQEDKLANA